MNNKRFYKRSHGERKKAKGKKRKKEERRVKRRERKKKDEGTLGNGGNLDEKILRAQIPC